MIIYVNGDSFTSGSELADHLIPGWPGFSKDIQNKKSSKLIEKFIKKKDNVVNLYVRESDIQNNVQPLKFFPEQVAGTKLFREIQETAERKSAWPNLLTYLNSSIEVINNSRGGAGITGICQRSVADLYNLKKQGKIPDIVFIQLTSTARQEIYSINSDAFMYEMPLTEDAFYFFDEHKDIAKSFIKAYGNEQFLFKYLYAMGLLNESVKSLTGRYPIFLDSLFLYQIRSDIDDFQNFIDNISKDNILNKEIIESTFRNLINLSRINDTDILSMSKFIKDTEYPYCVLGHLSPEMHHKFSQYIYDFYIKDFK